VLDLANIVCPKEFGKLGLDDWHTNLTGSNIDIQLHHRLKQPTYGDAANAGSFNVQGTKAWPYNFTAGK
jgi:hypothetical protein